MTINERIALRRKELNMTQQELATKVGYTSKSTINKIELGVNELKQKKIKMFAEALETTTSWLMGWEEKSPTSEDVELIPRYGELNPENKELINSMIEKLLKSQSSE